MKQKESELVKVCLEWLELKRICHWRNNTGAFKTERGGFYRFGSPGSPDIFAINKGVCYGIECKVNKNKLSDLQVDFKRIFTEAGGKYVEVRELEDIIKSFSKTSYSKTS